MKKITALFLLLAIFIPVLASCGTGGNASTTAPGDTTQGGDDSDLYDANGYLKDKLPESLDFNKATVTFLAYNDSEMIEFEAEASDGSSPVNDAIYKRNDRVENFLNIDLEYIYTRGDSDSWDNYYSKVETAARSGLNEFDILAANSRTIAQCAESGYATNLLDYSVLDFTAPWWSQTLLESSTIGGKLLYASGDISTNMLYSMYCVFFNEELISSYGLESPYDLVRSNWWTMDKLFEMCTGQYEDINTNNQRDSYDRYGIVNHFFAMDALFYGCGLTVVDYVDGYPTLGADFKGEKCYDWMVKMVDMYYTGQDAFYLQPNNLETFFTVRDVFGSGRSIFLIDYPCAVEKNLNDYEKCQYGIVPLPKWELTQESYITGMWYNYTLYSIFAPSQIKEIAATTMECLASQSYRTVTPAVFETTMKYQYALDDAGSQMFDIIRAGVMFDFGRTFSDSLSVHAAHTYRKKIAAGDSNWMSYMERLEPSLERSLQTIVDNFKKNYK